MALVLGVAFVSLAFDRGCVSLAGTAACGSWCLGGVFGSGEAAEGSVAASLTGGESVSDASVTRGCCTATDVAGFNSLFELR
jgi:hypothetical protein